MASILVNIKEYIISPEWDERKYLGLKASDHKSMFRQINVRYDMWPYPKGTSKSDKSDKAQQSGRII